MSTKMFMFIHCIIMNNTAMNNASESSSVMNNAAVHVRVCSISTCIIYVCSDQSLVMFTNYGQLWFIY